MARLFLLLLAAAGAASAARTLSLQARAQVARA
jgi:hypothetical protein